MSLKGLTDEETEALRTIFALACGRERVARKCRAHLDGDDTALADAPTIRNKLDGATRVIKQATKDNS